jgi:hypothetical protein
MFSPSVYHLFFFFSLLVCIMLRTIPHTFRSAFLLLSTSSTVKRQALFLSLPPTLIPPRVDHRLLINQERRKKTQSLVTSRTLSVAAHQPTEPNSNSKKKKLNKKRNSSVPLQLVLLSHIDLNLPFLILLYQIQTNKTPSPVSSRLTSSVFLLRVSSLLYRLPL